jgi:hypothetical protein
MSKTRRINYKDIQLDVEYEYEAYDAIEYNSTGFGGGVEILNIFCVQKDITNLFFYKIDIGDIEEIIIDIEDDE